MSKFNNDSYVDGSYTIYKELYQLYAITTNFGLEWVMGDIDPERHLQFLAELLPNSNLNYHDAVSSATRASDSCGYVAGQICDLILPEDHDMKDVSQKFMSIDKTIEFADNCVEKNYPYLMRVEVERIIENNEFLTSHSYVVIVHNANDINVLQAYVGHYTLDEYLLSKKWDGVREYNDSFSFADYLYLLRDLEQDSKLGNIYEEVFGSTYAQRLGKQMRISCRLHPLSINDACQSLLRKKKFIEKTVNKYPELISNAYPSFIKARLYQKNQVIFATFKGSSYLAMPSKLQVETFHHSLDNLSLLKIAKDSKVSKEITVSSWASFWKKLAIGVGIITAGGCLFYTLLKKD